MTLDFVADRTLQFLMRHLVKMASFSSETNMHSRNLAIVWAPNLLRFASIMAYDNMCGSEKLFRGGNVRRV